MSSKAFSITSLGKHHQCYVLERNDESTLGHLTPAITRMVITSQYHCSQRTIINISWNACSEQAQDFPRLVALGISIVTHHNLEIILTHWQQTGQQREKHEQIKRRNTNILYGEQWWVIPGHRAPPWPFPVKCSHHHHKLWVWCHPGFSTLITPCLFPHPQIGFGLHVRDVLWLDMILDCVQLQMCMFERIFSS